MNRRTLAKITLCVLATAVIVACSSSQNSAPVSDQGASPAASAQSVAVAHMTAFTPFRSVIPAALANKQCFLDGINGQPAGNIGMVASGSDVTFVGWAGNGRGQAGQQFVLVLKGAQDSYAAPLTTGVERADVAKALNSEAMIKSGYSISASLVGVAAGTYSLYIAGPEGSPADCDLHRTLTVQ